MPINRRLISRLSLVLLAGLVASALLASPAGAQARTVAATGSESRFVPNDAAEATFRVSLDRRSAREALAATSRRLRAVVGGIRRAGDIAGADLRTGAISVRRIRIRDESGRLVRIVYRASQSVHVVIRAVGRVGAVVRAGIAAGATNLSGPRFFVSDPDAVYDRALARAFDRARRKAQILAARAGSELGEVISISERGGVSNVGGGGQPQSDTGGAPGAAAPPVRPGRSRVTATVRVVFELQ